VILLIPLDNGIREKELFHIRAKYLGATTIQDFGKGDNELLVPISECTHDNLFEESCSSPGAHSTCPVQKSY
jgi:hypothetical protein